jgi:hypothetical protein
MGSDRQLGWGGLAADGLELYEVPGDHLSIIREDVRVLSEHFSTCLDRAQANERAFYAAMLSENKRQHLPRLELKLGFFEKPGFACRF